MLYEYIDVFLDNRRSGIVETDQEMLVYISKIVLATIHFLECNDELIII